VSPPENTNHILNLPQATPEVAQRQLVAALKAATAAGAKLKAAETVRLQDPDPPSWA